MAKNGCAFVSALIRNCPTLPEGGGAPLCVAPGCTYSGTRCAIFPTFLSIWLVRCPGLQVMEYLFTVVDRHPLAWSDSSRLDYIYYAPEAHIMYLTVSSSFLINFVMGGGGGARAGWLISLMYLSGPSRVIKFLYSPAPPPPTVWALKPSLCIKPPMHL